MAKQGVIQIMNLFLLLKWSDVTILSNYYEVIVKAYHCPEHWIMLYSVIFTIYSLFEN